MFDGQSITGFATGSPPSKDMVISISATVEVNGRQITVNTQDVRNLLTQGVVFSISAPVVLGTPEEFVDWLGRKLGLDFSLTKDVADHLPGFLAGPFEQFMNGQIILTVLTINQPLKMYQIGIVYQLQDPFTLFNGFLQFDSIGIMVSKASSQASPQGNVVTGDAGFFHV